MIGPEAFWSIVALMFLIFMMCGLLIAIAWSLRVAIMFLLGKPVPPFARDYVKQENPYHGYSGKLD